MFIFGRSLARGIYFEADKGTGSTVDAPGQNSGTEPAPTVKTYTETDVEAIVKERLDRQKRGEDERRTKAEREAAERALLDQQNYKTLAEQREARVKELEAVEGTLTRYKETVTNLLASQLDKVPEMYRELLKDRDPIDQLDWISRNADKIGAMPGVAPTPRTSTAPAGSLVDQFIQSKRGK